MARFAGTNFPKLLEIFLRLLRGDVVRSDDVRKTVLTPNLFRNDKD